MGFVYFLFTFCDIFCLLFVKDNVNKKLLHKNNSSLKTSILLLHKNNVLYLSLQNFYKDLYFTRMSQYDLRRVHAETYKILTLGKKVCICSILLNKIMACVLILVKLL